MKCSLAVSACWLLGQMAQNFPENLMEKNKINAAVDFIWVTFYSPICQGRIAGCTGWLCHAEVCDYLWHGWLLSWKSSILRDWGMLHLMGTRNWLVLKMRMVQVLTQPSLVPLLRYLLRTVV